MSCGGTHNTDDIRKLAEDMARENASKTQEDLESLSPEEKMRLLHELRVHQIELEMQNEELRRSQTELEASQARYFDLYDLAPVGYVTINDKGIIRQANLTAANLLGAARSDLAGKPMSRYIAPEDQDIYYMLNKRLSDTGEAQAREMRMQQSGGGQFWARVEASSAKDAGGAATCRAVISDITEQKRSEELFRDSARLNETLLDALPYPAMLINRDRKILASNKAAREAGAESGGFCWSSFMRLEHIDGHDKKHFEAHGYPPKGVTKCSFCQADRCLDSADNNLSSEFDASGKTWAAYWMPLDANTYLHFTIDITERKNAEKAQARYFEQDKMATVGRVAGKMAHDFNNVLGIILGTSELLKNEDLSPEVKAEIDIILESALKGRDITNNLVLFAKDHEPRLSQFDLNDRTNLVIRSIKSDLRGVAVSVQYGVGLENVLADAGLIENALINLIQNAIHAMSKTEKPRLKIRTYSDCDNAFIEITDNGCGIPARHAARIYDPAFTLKGAGDRAGAYRRDIKGSGYGMANVKRCVDKHGGTIEFESEAGQGTTFKISLPFIKDALAPEEVKQLRLENVAEGKRILIVEDEPNFGRILHSLLNKFNHRIDLTTLGKSALANFESNDYDVISLDYILPDTTGMDVYRKIRETNKDVPILFVSGNFEFKQSIIDLKSEDPNVDLLSKPFKNVEYVNAIHRQLGAGAATGPSGDVSRA